MLESELDIFVYHARHGIRRLFTYRRWMFLAPLLVLAVSAAGGLLLWRYYDGHEALVERSRLAESQLVAQKARLLALREQARRLVVEAGRISSFDAKLGVMLTRPGENGGMGALPASELVPEALGRRLNDFLDSLAGRMAVEEVHQQALLRSLAERKLEFMAKPSLWPLHGYITSGFGLRPSPFGRGGDFHNGVDIKAPTGTPVHAPGAGRITEAGFMHGYGLRVVISHDFGLETIFAHLKKVEVKPGDLVKRGQRIGLSGNSGRTTGAHLHYEIHANGTPVNPRQYMLD